MMMMMIAVNMPTKKIIAFIKHICYYYYYFAEHVCCAYLYTLSFITRLVTGHLIIRGRPNLIITERA